jgi:hypothetical protein
VRLAWHSSGTYNKADGTGGSNGATMRFKPESEHGANAGLAVARALLEPIKAKFPWISYGDLWTLAGVTAIEAMGGEGGWGRGERWGCSGSGYMGPARGASGVAPRGRLRIPPRRARARPPPGPTIPWKPGRVDATNGEHCPPDGRLPDAALGAAHIRDVFGRMGFTERCGGGGGGGGRVARVCAWQSGAAAVTGAVCCLAVFPDLITRLPRAASRPAQGDGRAVGRPHARPLPPRPQRLRG